MTTAVDPNVDTIPVSKEAAEGEGEEEEIEPPMTFREYMSADNIYELMQKRWGIWSIVTAISYIYSFVMAIYGVDMFCHYSRFFNCSQLDAPDANVVYHAKKYLEFSAAFDAYIILATVHHLWEWFRQWVLLTVIIVGQKWMKIYYLMSLLGAPFGLIATLIAFIGGISNSCGEFQTQRAGYLKLQIISFLLYIPFTLHPVYMFKFCDKYLHPPKGEDGSPSKFESYLHALWNEAEDDDDD